MALPFGTNLFPPRGEIIETFDFNDIATGLGFENFWATVIIDTGSTKTQLIPFQVTPRAIFPAGTSTTQIGVGTTTLNFDTSTFNLPRTARGTAYITYSAKQTVSTAIIIKAQMAVVDSGGTPTTISSEFTANQYTTINADVADLLAMPLTQTNIKVGEKLRLIIKMEIDASAGNGVLNHDNTNSDSDLHLKLLMPFRIVD